jgi:hypothetical protein
VRFRPCRSNTSVSDQPCIWLHTDNSPSCNICPVPCSAAACQPCVYRCVSILAAATRDREDHGQRW